MFKKTLIFILVIGVILVAVGLIMTGGDFEKIVNAFNSDNDYSFKEESGSEEVKDLNIKLVSGNVVFHIYDGEGYKLDYYESEYDTKKITFENSCLKIDNNVKAKFRFFNISFNSKKISAFNIYLPKTFCGKVNIQTVSGDITINDFNFKSLNIELTSGNAKLSKVIVEGDTNINSLSGDINLSNFQTNSLIIKATSGIIDLKDTVINLDANLKSTSGRVKISASIIPSIVIHASSGNVEIINVECDNVDARLFSGNAKITIYGNSDEYKIDASVSSGNIHYQGRKIDGSLYDPSGTKSLKVKCSSGNIEINFIKK